MRLVFFRTVLVLGLVLAGPHAASATTIHLRSGQFLHGEIVAHDEAGIKFRRWDNNGLLSIVWEQLADGEDRRLRSLLGISDDAEETVDGVRLILDTGEAVEGVIVDENASRVVVRTQKVKQRQIPPKSVKSREAISLPALDYYSAQELYDLRAKAHPPKTASEHLVLARLCRKLRLFDAAGGHYAKACEADPTIADSIKAEMDAVAAQAQETGALALLDEVDRALAEGKFADARTALEKLKTQFPNSSAAAGAKALEDKIAQDEAVAKTSGGGGVKAAPDKLTKEYYALLKSLIGKVAGDKTFTIDDSREYLDKILPGELLDKLAVKMKMDRAALEEQWKNRAPTETRQASYGDGSWIVAGKDPGKLPDSGSTGGLEDFKKQKEQQKAIDELRQKARDNKNYKEQTDAEWWSAANPAKKTTWLEAAFVEQHLKVVEVRFKNCGGCGGSGVVVSPQTQFCRRCEGLGKEKILTYQ